MKSKKFIENILRQIMTEAELTPELTANIETIISDYDERDSILSEHYDVSGDDDLSMEKKVIDDGYKEKYSKLKADYVNRFFGGVTEDESEELEEKNQNEEEKVSDDLSDDQDNNAKAEEIKINDIFEEE